MSGKEHLNIHSCCNCIMLIIVPREESESIIAIQGALRQHFMHSYVNAKRKETTLSKVAHVCRQEVPRQ
jgi:hypothetical protein